MIQYRYRIEECACASTGSVLAEWMGEIGRRKHTAHWMPCNSILHLRWYISIVHVHTLCVCVCSSRTPLMQSEAPLLYGAYWVVHPKFASGYSQTKYPWPWVYFLIMMSNNIYVTFSLLWEHIRHHNLLIRPILGRGCISFLISLLF